MTIQVPKLKVPFDVIPSLATDRTNLCTNPRGGVDTAGWTPTSLLTFERTSNPQTQDGLPLGAIHDGQTTAFHCVGDAEDDRAVFSVAVLDGITYTFSIYTRIKAANPAPTATGLRLQVRDSGGAIEGNVLHTTVGGPFVRLSATVTPDETANWTLSVRQSGLGDLGWYFTAVLIEEAQLVGEYFDGGSPFSEWEGAPHASRSRFQRVFRSASAQVVEQDSLDEIAQCVYAAVAFELGQRDELPEFGISSQAFRKGGADLAEIRSAVERAEPRAEVLTDAQFADLIQRVRVGVS